MQEFKKLAFVIIGTLLNLTLLSCSGGGGGGGGGGVTVGGNSSPTIITGYVVDGFVAGATVTAYIVNANGTLGPQIGTPVTTDQNGNYTLNLGTYSGPVYLTSQGGTYTDTVTGSTINLNIPPYSSMILSAIVPNASGNVTVQINPLTTMAANVALTLTGQGIPVATAADAANASVQNYFGLTASILNTALVNLTTAGCMTGNTQPSADVSAILAGISQLAYNNGVKAPDLVQALIQDVTSDGLFNGLASGVTVSLPLTSGTGTIPLSQIEGTGLTGLASAISTFMTSTTSNVCGATVDTSVTSALSNTNIFTVPAAPTGVTATAGPGSITIGWNAVTRATSYNVYMATSTGVTATSNQLPGYRSIPNVTSPYAVSTGLTTGTTYYFVVTAVSGTSPYVGSESAASAEVSATALAPAQWAQTVTAGSSGSSFDGVTVASDGSVYAAGYISGGTGTVNFGNNVISLGTNTVSNATLVKYSSSGAALTAQTVAGSDMSSFSSVSSSVSVTSDGSVYAAGYIYGTGTYNFGNGVTAQGTYTGSNIVLVKYNSSGIAQWAQTAAGSDVSSFSGVSVASDGSVYAAGYIRGTGSYNFGGVAGAITGPSNGYNPVLVKYSSSGVAQWAKTVTAASVTGLIDESSFSGVSAAPDGSVYAVGYIAETNSTTFNFGGVVTAKGPYSSGNIVLVKYNGSGAALWAQTVTLGPADSYFTSVSVAPDGSVYAAGYIQGTGTYYNFGGSVVAAGTNSNGINIVLVKYNGSGVALWAQTVTAGSNNSLFYSVSAGSDGSVYAAGHIDGIGTFNFGNGMTATGVYSYGANSLLVTYDSTGVTRWAQTVTGTGTSNSYFNGVFAASDGSAYAAGSIYGTGTYIFGNNMTATGTYSGNNIVLAKYKGSGSVALSW